MKHFVVIVLCVSSYMLHMAMGQRAPFAGARPNGYKDRLMNKTGEQGLNDNNLANRFGENGVTSTTQRLPHGAIGDAALVDQLNRLPVDQRPFWLINYQAIEAQKNGGSAPAAVAPNSPQVPFFAGGTSGVPSTATNSVNLADRFGGADSNLSNPTYAVVSKQEIVYPIEHPLYVPSSFSSTPIVTSNQLRTWPIADPWFNAVSSQQPQQLVPFRRARGSY